MEGKEEEGEEGGEDLTFFIFPFLFFWSVFFQFSFYVFQFPFFHCVFLSWDQVCSRVCSWGLLVDPRWTMWPQRGNTWAPSP